MSIYRRCWVRSISRARTPDTNRTLIRASRFRSKARRSGATDIYVHRNSFFNNRNSGVRCIWFFFWKFFIRAHMKQNLVGPLNVQHTNVCTCINEQKLKSSWLLYINPTMTNLLIIRLLQQYVAHRKVKYNREKLLCFKKSLHSILVVL
jgi:hypothetical protein